MAEPIYQRSLYLDLRLAERYVQVLPPLGELVLDARLLNQPGEPTLDLPQFSRVARPQALQVLHVNQRGYAVSIGHRTKQLLWRTLSKLLEPRDDRLRQLERVLLRYRHRRVIERHQRPELRRCRVSARRHQ